MTMQVIKSNEEMASDFIMGTCELIPKPFSPSSDHMHDLPLLQDPIPRQYSIVCGSLAEFYIRPMITCIADLDVLLCRADQLAFSGDFPVLPSDISGLCDSIDCFEIESYYAFPGFVRLRLLGEMKYNWKHKEYKFQPNIGRGTCRPTCICMYYKMDRTHILNAYKDLSNRIFGESRYPEVISGPAIKTLSKTDFHAENDDVISLFCPQWPRDAQTWPLRPRNSGWPTSDTIFEVVRNGCHVVYSQHRACRDDQYQWRLSFSVAEVILLHSWTKTQQIIYHLLRFFAKRELIKKDCSKEDEVLCAYHLKTLMLWTCEEMPPQWWDSSPVIAICCELLNILSDWLKRRNCPNYFIPEANLFHHSSTSTLLHQTERRVNDFQNCGVLGRWFVENYILPIFLRHFRVFNPEKVTTDFMNYMPTLITMRKAAMPISVEFVVARKFFDSDGVWRRAIKMQVSGIRWLLKSQQSEGNYYLKRYKKVSLLPTTENVLCLKHYDFLLFSLQFAYSLCIGDIRWDISPLVEFVNSFSWQPKVTRSQFHNFPKAYRARNSRHQFMRSLGLMENLTGLNSRSEFQLVSLMSKEFLRRTLEADSYESNGVTTAALIYLAALHFASSEYQQAMRLCFEVLKDKTSQKDQETLNAGCLMFINDVARIVGLCVLHRKITNIAFPCIGTHFYLDLRLSPDVFAHYLTVVSSETRSIHLDFGRDWPVLSFLMDIYLKALIKPQFFTTLKSGTQSNDVRQIVYYRIGSLTETEATATNPSIATCTVVKLLMEIALENMMSFYSEILKDIGMQYNISIVDCYRALYCYKCLNYDEVFQLCERILNEPDLHIEFNELALGNVSMIPPLDSFFDGDVQSLLGFHTLFYYLSPVNDDLRKSDVTEFSTFEDWFEIHVKFAKIGLYGCLYASYSIICHYFVGRHFLARYLKAKCCIDCNLPHKEAMTEFASQKTNFPFELIIRRFLLRRHRLISSMVSLKITEM